MLARHVAEMLRSPIGMVRGYVSVPLFLPITAPSRMSETSNPTNLLDEIDAQQDDVLQQLDALNGRIEQLLREFTRGDASSEASSQKAA